MGHSKVGELHHGYGAMRIAGGWRVLELKLGAILRQRVFGEVGQFPAQQIFAVFADIKFDGLDVIVDLDVDLGFQQAGDAGFRGSADGDLHVGAEGIERCEGRLRRISEWWMSRCVRRGLGVTRLLREKNYGREGGQSQGKI